MSHVDEGTLHAYLDGEQLPAERALLEAHVAECPACRARLDEERALIERASHLLGLAQAPERAAPPPPLHQLRHPRLAWRLRMPLAWAATVVLAIGVGYYLGGTSFRSAPLADSSATLTTVRPTDSFTPIAAFAYGDRDSIAPTRRANEAGHTGKAPARTPAEPPIIVDGALAEREQVADQRVAPKARADSVAAQAGVVAIDRRLELRAPTPAPVPSAAAPPSPARAEADLRAARGRLVATEWPIIQRQPAREMLGTDPVGVPGLAVREMRRSPAGDGVVLVEQQLDSTTVIQLFQRRVEADRAARDAAPAAGAPALRRQLYAETERLARFVGSLRVEIAGPLPEDSLNKLLEQVQPIRR
ncbi:MAG TPA: zf-HC2 domain-containing protein [Gemmatimonadales bacterium]|jgi:hypothetical protein|nr:zf-HC2 domain-containing protein [Gemmatimonadales bacterium]